MARERRFALDTNILSEPTRPVPDPAILAHLQRFEDELAVPAPVWHELVFGVARLPASQRRTTLERYLKEVILASLPILPYDDTAATWHGKERARLEAIGTRPPFVDGQIAAIAAVHDLTLVTSNTRDFERFEGLKLVDWRRRTPG